MTPTEHDPVPLQATDEERRRIRNRLKRLEGQIRGLQAMIDADKDCQAVLTQVMAAKSALNQVGLLIIGHSMKTCLSEGASVEREDIIDEAIGLLTRYVNLPETWSDPDPS